MFAFALLPSLAVFNVFVDPYGIFPLASFSGAKWPKVEMINNVKLHKSIKVSQLKPEAVVLGTSRSAFGIDPNSNAWHESFKSRYNLSLAGGNTYVTYRYLEHAHTLSPLKQVIFGLDFFAFNTFRRQASDYRGDFLIVNDDGSYNPHYKNNILSASLLSTDALKSSFNTITSKKKTPITISENGMFIGPIWKDHLHEGFLAMEKLYFQHVYLAGKNREYAFINPDTGASSLEDFRKLVIYCSQNKIDLKLFISPLHARHQEVIRTLGIWFLFEQWKREIVTILEEENYTSELWDFSGYNSITTDSIFANSNNFYRDSTHYHPIIGDMILSRISHNNDNNIPIDFGHILTQQNIEDHLFSIQEEQTRYRTEHPEDVIEIESMSEKYDFELQDLALIKNGAHSNATWQAK